MKDKLIFALDVPDNSAAKSLVEVLGDEVTFYKIGLQLFMAGQYFELLDWLKNKGKKVFVDLKFFDIPETVALAIEALEKRGADFATIHGNDAIMRAAFKAKDKIKILAVTALTSLDQGDLDDLGFKCDIENLVLSRAKRALEIGLDGVVSSGLEAKKLRQNLGQKLLIVTPGIRPVINKEDDQKRTVDIKTAFENGASHIVMGRPIRDAKNPKAAAKEAQEIIKGL